MCTFSITVEKVRGLCSTGATLFIEILFIIIFFIVFNLHALIYAWFACYRYRIPQWYWGRNVLHTWTILYHIYIQLCGTFAAGLTFTVVNYVFIICWITLCRFPFSYAFRVCLLLSSYWVKGETSPHPCVFIFNSTATCVSKTRSTRS